LADDFNHYVKIYFCLFQNFNKLTGFSAVTGAKVSGTGEFEFLLKALAQLKLAKTKL